MDERTIQNLKLQIYLENAMVKKRTSINMDREKDLALKKTAQKIFRDF